jgi:hypothetical protein
VISHHPRGTQRALERETSDFCGLVLGGVNDTLMCDLARHMRKEGLKAGNSECALELYIKFKGQKR